MHGLQKSPPLRKGTRARTGGNSHVDNPPTELRADPGMVLNYKPQEQAAPAAAPPPPDLLDFDGLSMDGPPTGQSAAPTQVCIIGICNAFFGHYTCTSGGVSAESAALDVETSAHCTIDQLQCTFLQASKKLLAAVYVEIMHPV